MNHIESISLPSKDATLRAVFSQIMAEVRKTGRVLADDEGSFYVSRRFGWKSTVKDFFDAYHAICDRKQVPPIYQESQLGTALKVPYASIETLRLLQDATQKRLLQLRDKGVAPFRKLPDNAQAEDLKNLMRIASDDKDVCQFLRMVILIDEELRAYVSRLDSLAAAYDERVSAFSMALRGAVKKRIIRRKKADAEKQILSILDPYISKLKKQKIIASSWKYDFARLPLTDEAARRMGLESMSSLGPGYWEKDELPSKPKPAKPHKDDGFALSRPSLWHRFDEWVSDIGDWFAYKMDDITDWMMTAWVWLVIAYAVIAVIAVWVTKGFFSALVAVFVLFVVVGLLSGILGIVAGIIAWIVKYITYVPLFLLRCIFYRGWTLILTLAAVAGYFVYRYLIVPGVLVV